MGPQLSGDRPERQVTEGQVATSSLHGNMGTSDLEIGVVERLRPPYTGIGKQRSGDWRGGQVATCPYTWKWEHSDLKIGVVDRSRPYT